MSTTDKRPRANASAAMSAGPTGSETASATGPAGGHVQTYGTSLHPSTPSSMSSPALSRARTASIDQLLAVVEDATESSLLLPYAHGTAADAGSGAGHAHPTSASTIFHAASNAVNVVMGLGVLSLPYAFSLSGWALGLAGLAVFALLACWSATLIGECLAAATSPPDGPAATPSSGSLDRRLGDRSTGSIESASRDSAASTVTVGSRHAASDADHGTKQTRSHMLPSTLADMAALAFGRPGRLIVTVLFTMELFAASVALVILFGDSVQTLFPAAFPHGSSHAQWIKVAMVCALIPATWMRSLKVFSAASVVGILSLCNLIGILVYEGLVHTQTPGSILVPAATTLWVPANATWDSVAVAVGLLFVGFDGHSVFPSIYRDMHAPQTTFSRAMSLSYSVIFSIYAITACCGYAMFGTDVLPEVTKSLALLPGVHPLLLRLTIWFIALNPVTKFAMVLNPVNVLAERTWASLWQGPAGGTQHQPSMGDHQPHRVIRTLTALAVLGVAVAVPSFDKVMALLGSFLAVSVVLIVPFACHLKLYWHRLGLARRAAGCAVILGAVCICLFGTAGVVYRL
ncbi:transmembrane amino acid transporter protein-domain-containing protein [Entophlyctis helioformis]|nr:transmembrane amino acid transporter protein-domain-containing protein [Entophlyctis helioformis]